MFQSNPLIRFYHRPLKTKRATIIAVFVMIVVLVLFYAFPSYLTHHLQRKNPRHQKKFLAYLPHSGFSNQRIELANAIMLAGLLNRTLIVPPARLGRGIGWKPKGQLFSRLEWLRALKDFANRCQPPTPSKPATYLLGTKCEEYRHFATIRWSELHNIATLDNDVRFRFVDFVSPTKLQDMLRIDAAETYTHTDERLYDWYCMKIAIKRCKSYAIGRIL